MVKIVTGKINSLKSTKLEKHYQKHKKGDGFISKKRMSGHIVEGYDLLCLKTKEVKPFIINDKFYTIEKGKVDFKLGPYLFLSNTLTWINERIDFWIKEKVSPIYLDEIGMLELKGQGYYKGLKKLLEVDVDLVLVIRSDLIQSIVDYFNIIDFQVMRDEDVR